MSSTNWGEEWEEVKEWIDKVLTLEKVRSVWWVRCDQSFVSLCWQDALHCVVQWMTIQEECYPCIVMHIHIHPLDPDCSCHIARIASNKTPGMSAYSQKVQQLAYEALRGFSSPQYGKTSVAFQTTSGGQAQQSVQVSVSSVQLLQ